eukprot:6205383-Pleurochrysis_carterae.AAC.1
MLSESAGVDGGEGIKEMGSATLPLARLTRPPTSLVPDFLRLQRATLDRRVAAIASAFPPPSSASLISAAEASLVVLATHLQEVRRNTTRATPHTAACAARRVGVILARGTRRKCFQVPIRACRTRSVCYACARSHARA